MPPTQPMASQTRTRDGEVMSWGGAARLRPVTRSAAPATTPRAARLSLGAVVLSLVLGPLLSLVHTVAEHHHPGGHAVHHGHAAHHGHAGDHRHDAHHGHASEKHLEEASAELVRVDGPVPASLGLPPQPTGGLDLGLGPVASAPEGHAAARPSTARAPSTPRAPPVNA